jgi:hypothetical protein
VPVKAYNVIALLCFTLFWNDFISGTDRSVFHTHRSRSEPSESGDLYGTCDMLTFYREYLLDPVQSSSCWLSRLLIQYTRCYPPHIYVEFVSCIPKTRTRHAVVRRMVKILRVVLNTWKYIRFVSGSRIFSYTSPQASISKLKKGSD